MTEIRHCGASNLILIAEGDGDLRATLHELLESEGYQVALACDENEVIRCLGGLRRPALVLLDLALPTMSEAPILATLLADPYQQQIPVVALTADGRANPEGVVAILRKPFEIQELLLTVSRFSHVFPGL